jgi:hypothetical protein
MQETQIVESTTERKIAALCNDDWMDFLLNIKKRVALRFLSDDEWIEKHASGTLRHSKNLGLNYSDLYFHERIAFEFGATFTSQNKGLVSMSPLVIEGDCHPLTEFGWYVRKYLLHNIFDEDKFVPCKILVSKMGGADEGAALVCTHSSAPWLPTNHVIYCMISSLIDGVWQEAVSPA